MQVMHLQNFQIHRTNGTITHYSGDLVNAVDCFKVVFSVNAGGGGMVAYNTENGELYHIVSVNNVGNFDLSTWQNGDDIEIYPIAINEGNGVMLG
ncbi:MAG: hypothetical protein E7131_05635 [Rikenellaceae bacterium]|nr:hypothetical protein [Rikenellaceae bacterium]